MKISKGKSLLLLIVGCFLTIAPSTSTVQVNAQADVRTNVGATSRSASSANGPATLAELRSRIEEIVRQPALEPGFFAVKIVSLDNGHTVFEQSANKFVRPA